MKKMNVIFQFLLVAASFTAVHAQNMSHDMTMPMASPDNMVSKAVCVLYPTQGNTATGVVTFTKIQEGVKIVADLQGLSKGKHGIHIHECGDCTAVDGSSAGGHFNPRAEGHGAPVDAVRHAGDMGNIEADDSGKAHLEYVDHTISLEGQTSIIGRTSHYTSAGR